MALIRPDNPDNSEGGDGDAPCSTPTVSTAYLRSDWALSSERWNWLWARVSDGREEGGQGGRVLGDVAMDEYLAWPARQQDTLRHPRVCTPNPKHLFHISSPYPTYTRIDTDLWPLPFGTIRKKIRISLGNILRPLQIRRQMSREHRVFRHPATGVGCRGTKKPVPPEWITRCSPPRCMWHSRQCAEHPRPHLPCSDTSCTARHSQRGTSPPSPVRHRFTLIFY